MTKEDLVYDYIQTFNVVKFYYEEVDNEIYKLIQSNEDVLFKKVYEDILEYCKYNNVYMENFDDYKIVYFLAIRLFEITNNKKILYIMIVILNALVFNDSKIFVNDDMLNKIKLNIKNNNWEKFYGKYGIYSMFKVCSKHLV